MSLVDYHLATAGIWLNSSSVKGGIISSPLLLLEGNPILLMTPKDGCADITPHIAYGFLNIIDQNRGALNNALN